MQTVRIGVLSDTHGLLRPAVLERLAGSDLLLHAGDVGSLEVLQALAEVAPVQAVRGNVDASELGLPSRVEGEIGGLTYRMTHRREDVPQAWARGPGLVLFGHSHRPEMEWFGGCLFLNPGACGPRRFRLPLTVATVTVRGDRFIPEILAIE